MPVCSYVVVPEQGGRDRVADALARLPGCEAIPAENADVVLLLTDTPGAQEDQDLRERIEAVSGVHALLMSFGEIDPDTEERDPLARRRPRELPVLPTSADCSPIAEGAMPAPGPGRNDA